MKSVRTVRNKVTSVECKFFNRPGGCRNGTKCRFLHVYDDASQKIFKHLQSHKFGRSLIKQQCKNFAIDRCRLGKKCTNMHKTTEQMYVIFQDYIELSGTTHGQSFLDQICFKNELYECNDLLCKQSHRSMNVELLAQRDWEEMKRMYRKTKEQEELKAIEDQKQRERDHEYQEMLDSRFGPIWQKIFELLRESIINSIIPIPLVRMISDYVGSDQTHAIELNIHTMILQSRKEEIVGSNDPFDSDLSTCFNCFESEAPESMYIAFASCVPIDIEMEKCVKAKIFCNTCMPIEVLQPDREWCKGKFMSFDYCTEFQVLGINDRWKIFKLNHVLYSDEEGCGCEDECDCDLTDYILINSTENNAKFNMTVDGYIDWKKDYLQQCT
jgi:hypothetical protein